MLRVPQLAQIPVAVVISLPKTATRVPAIAFPSSASIGLGPGGAEAFGPDLAYFVPELREGVRSGLREPGGAAHGDERALARRPRDFVEELLVDPSRVPAPSVRLLAGEREADVDHVVGADPHQLLAVDDVRERARRVEQPHRHSAFDRLVVAQDRAERHHAGAAADEQERAAERLLP